MTLARLLSLSLLRLKTESDPMIAWKRKRGQSVRVGNVVVTVLDCGSNCVRLGFDAPPDVEVVRCDSSDRDDDETRFNDRRGCRGDTRQRLPRQRRRTAVAVARSAFCTVSTLGRSLLPSLIERTDALARWVMRRRLHRDSGFGPATGSVAG